MLIIIDKKVIEIIDYALSLYLTNLLMYSMTVTNGIIKLVASLSQKKNRDDQGCFVAEGTKCVRDTWDFFNCKMIIATKEWYEQCGHSGHLDKIYFATKSQMQKMSQFSTASDVIAVYETPVYDIKREEIENDLNIVLDGIQDPGNLGTIMRLADWYGIKNIFCSKTTVDVFNHKVVQATMGAISRVKVYYCDLLDLFDEYREIPVYGTFLEGKNIYKADLSERGFVVFGNEGRGISKELRDVIDRKLLIPSYPQGVVTSESLNVGVAAAITISEFRRRIITNK